MALCKLWDVCAHFVYYAIRVAGQLLNCKRLKARNWFLILELFPRFGYFTCVSKERGDIFSCKHFCYLAGHCGL